MAEETEEQKKQKLERANELAEATSSRTEPNLAKAVLTIQEQCEGLSSQIEDLQEKIVIELATQKGLLEKILKMLSW